MAVMSGATPLPRLRVIEASCVTAARRIAVVAVIGMLLLSLLTVVDVSLRYFFNSPILGLDEATQLIMAVIISASLPIGIATRNHVSIDFFRSAIGPRYEAIMEAISGALILGMLAILTLRFGAYT